MGFPLPNCGRLEKCPVDAVICALTHLAHLVDGLSACLAIPLPHPIQPHGLNGPVISPQFDLNMVYPLLPLTVLSTRDRIRDSNWELLETALQREDGEYIINTSFATVSLILLQADVVSLCLHAGLSAAALYPPPAMLLNLALLWRHCKERVRHLIDGQGLGGVVDAVEVMEDEQMQQQQRDLIDPAVLVNVEDELCRRFEPKQQFKFARPPASSMSLETEDWQLV